MAAAPLLPRGLVTALGSSQLICWGISYYLIGVFAEAIIDDTGWTAGQVHGGYSLALVVMGLVSARIGRWIDRRGGRVVMSTGSLLCAAACTLLALATSLTVYYLAWALLGLAMRMFLYDTAFAALARIGGTAARPAISHITLLGGLASTVFWPFGHWLIALLGWRTALLVYAVIATATLLLHRRIPDIRSDQGTSAAQGPVRQPHRHHVVCTLLFTWIVTCAGLLNAAMSAHMIGLMSGLGLSTALAIQLAALRGVGQTSARLVEVFFGRRWHPATLNLAATALLPFAFVVALPTPLGLVGGLGFAILYGAGNGLVTITRGSLPLVLFDSRVYGHLVGRLLAPGFLVAAAAPLAFAWLQQALGAAPTMGVALAIATSMSLASLLLWHLARSA
ncbi:MAG: MFS transporter [Rhodocyclaceae bacterium]|nr:MFS transporter [Rhodocyclaceae bacterium]